MRIAAITDIHGNLAALQAVLQDIARRGADVTVNLGDILSGPLQADETADCLMPLNLPTLAGNHERQLLAVCAQPRERWDTRSSDGFSATQMQAHHLAWLRSLPMHLWLGGEVLLVHGTPRSDDEYNLETVLPALQMSFDGDDQEVGEDAVPGTRAATLLELRERFFGPDGQALRASQAGLILCGHTHVPRACTVDGVLIVNPGSVGLPGFDHDMPHLHYVETYTPHARYALLEKTLAGWQCEHVAVPYAHEPQAQLAAQRGRPDWAVALRTGRMSL